MDVPTNTVVVTLEELVNGYNDMVLCPRHFNYIDFPQIQFPGERRRARNELVVPANMTPQRRSRLKARVLKDFSVSTISLMPRLTEFLRKSPGIKNLSTDDLIALLKGGYFECWMVHMSRINHLEDDVIKVCDGKPITKQHVSILFDEEFSNELFNLLTALNSLELDEAEEFLFMAVIMLNSGRVFINEIEAIDSLQKIFKEALRLKILTRRHMECDAFILLMERMSELQNIGTNFYLKLDWFRENWRLLTIHALFAEVFDIRAG